MDRQEFSSIVSLTLDSMGYSYETVKQRQTLDLSDTADGFSILEDNSACRIIAGSTAEGLSHVFSPINDTDIMEVLDDMSVSEDTPNTKSFNKDDCLLQMECDNVAPGYTMIKCMKMKNNSMLDFIEQQNLECIDLVERNDCYYLRHCWNGQTFKDIRDSQTYSETTKTGNGDDETFEMKFSGPAVNFNFETLQSKIKISIDVVYAIPCFCSCHIRNWATRTKYYGWPDKKLTSKLKNEIGYVVPVGFKGSRNFELEWRICYTGIELNLIRSLNETQIKMYVLLKIVAKAILKPVCKDITSYVIKNLVLWIVERNSNEIFTSENLTSLVMLGLRFLRNKVKLRLFGSYMIPERNLFAGKITEYEKVETVRLLDEMLAEGPMFLMKFKELNGLKNAIDKTMHKPLLAEMEKKLWYYYSLLPLNAIGDETDPFFQKVFLGTYLVVIDSELEDHYKAKLKILCFETEIAYERTRLEKIEKDLMETFDSLYKNENSVSVMNDFWASQ